MVECLGVFCSFCFKNFKELSLRNQKGCYSAFSLDKSRIADTCQFNFNAHAIYWPFFGTCINLEGFTCARPHTQALLWCVWRIKAADLWGRDAPLKMALSGCRLLLMTPLCTRHNQKEVRSPSGRQPADVLRAARWRQRHFDNLCSNPCLAEDCQSSSTATGPRAGIKPGNSDPCPMQRCLSVWTFHTLEPL